MFKEFRDFAMRGNVVDLAVGIIIGAAFTGIVNSLVKDILMPPIGLLLGKVDFSGLFINLSDRAYPTVAAAKAAGAPTINYGIFINTVIDFILMALAVFLIIKQVNRLKSSPPPAPADTKECPFCISSVPLRAVRCPHCTSSLEEN